MTSIQVGILVQRIAQFSESDHVAISIENIAGREDEPLYICSFDICSNSVRYHSHEFDICSLGLLEIDNIKEMLGYEKKTIKLGKS